MLKKVVITVIVIFAAMLFSACVQNDSLPSKTVIVIEEKQTDQTLSPMDVQKSREQAADVDESESLPMFSSFAHMRSFDPKTGIAQFDFFEMLKGAEAVDYLINFEGYCSAAAETETEQLGEGDFLEKNLSYELRQINLKKVPVLLLYTVDGCSITDAQGVKTSFEDIVSLYNRDKTKLLLSGYYYITADEDTGEVLIVEQVKSS